MNIQGLQKLTLLDYPGKMACTIFTAGCNLRCPFCHNSRLVINPEKQSEYSDEEIFAFLKKRVGVLDGVAITGGEPLLQKDIEDFISCVKDLGYSVKLDTNGTFPEKLRSLVEKGLVDYVAMDIKNSPELYAETVGISGYDISKIKESIAFLLEGKVDYEFRTTIVREFHSVFGMNSLGEMIKGAKRHFLQGFIDSGELIGFGMSAVPKEEMERMKKIMLQYVDECEIRGV
ncbi:MAG: anaerobic ribonucleoside-triphosphate reductase activating protein [Clostridia bacterium]|nr:anaerobic ribonucleoside-triphosphate reductase activating protein [Clostridia bacterium]MBR3780120.1 anaerobic ribonucleoside-triphosphate reductase activating protein [Clostridia bacterium]